MDSFSGNGHGPDQDETTNATDGLGLTANQILEIFEPSLNDLRNYLLPIMGSIALEAIFRNAIRENKTRFPFLSSLTTKASDLSFNVLKNEPIPPSQLLRGIFEFMQSIIGLLTELTGDVLARKANMLVKGIAGQLKGNRND